MIKYFTLFLSLLIFVGCQSKTDNSSTPSMDENSEIMENTHRKLRHVVMIKFKPSASEADIQKVEEAFSALPGKIPEIRGYEWGVNNSPEGLDQGLTHCFLVTFSSEKDREIYLPHPEHKAFVDILEPHLDRVLVVDYWANEE